MKKEEDSIMSDKELLEKSCPDERYLLLQASWHNWGELTCGDQVKKTWKVYSDGYYNYESVDIGFHIPRDNTYIYEGTMDEKSFRSLCASFGSSKWPQAHRDGDDGEAWQLILLDIEGNTINTTGKLGYVYGMTIIENIADLLRKNCRGEHLIYEDVEEVSYPPEFLALF